MSHGQATAGPSTTPSFHSKSLLSLENTSNITDLPPEDDEGAIEYKLRLVDPTPQRFVQLVTQMKFRLSEGAGECFYEVGVEDNGTRKGISDSELKNSIETLERMAAELGAEASVLSETAGREGNTATVIVRRIPKTLTEYTDIRIATCGNVDSGKLIAYCTHASKAHHLTVQVC